MTSKQRKPTPSASGSRSRRKQRSSARKQRQVTIRRAELPDRVENLPSLRAAAETIEGVGGRIERGKFGLKITIPERVTPETGDGTSGMVERSARESLAVAAETLVDSEAFVLSVVDDLASARKPTPLSERLPDEAPAIGSVA